MIARTGVIQIKRNNYSLCSLTELLCFQNFFSAISKASSLIYQLRKLINKPTKLEFGMNEHIVRIATVRGNLDNPAQLVGADCEHRKTNNTTILSVTRLFLMLQIVPRSFYIERFLVLRLARLNERDYDEIYLRNYDALTVVSIFFLSFLLTSLYGR